MKVLTPAEYEALGYVQRADFDRSMFDVKPDKPLTQYWTVPVYRSETKEEFYVDAIIGSTKVVVAWSTGGLAGAAKTALGYTLSVLS